MTVLAADMPADEFQINIRYYITDMAKQRPAKDFSRPFYQILRIYLSVIGLNFPLKHMNLKG